MEMTTARTSSFWRLAAQYFARYFFGGIGLRGKFLRRSEACLAEAQRLSGTGSFGWSVSHGAILWSQETSRSSQYDPTTKPTVELILQLTHPEDARFVKQTIERAPLDGKDFDIEQ